jgi:AcrR family transcriptional regulator
MAEASSERATDGRQLRGQRARALVADALLELIDEGDLRPTAPRIAARAGVSLRLVFHHFHDLEELFAAAARRHTERILPTLRPLVTEGPLEERIEALVTDRARLYERVTKVRRAALLLEPFSSVVSRRLAEVRALKRSATARVFAHELARVSPELRRDLRAALGVATSFATWESLRAHQGLSVAAARRAIAFTLRALLQKESV